MDQAAGSVAAGGGHDLAGLCGIVDRSRIGLAPEGRDHRDVGVAVEEHLLGEHLRRIAVERPRRAFGRLAEHLLQHPPPDLPGAAGRPGAARLDAMGLDVEDELVAAHRRGGGLLVERRLLRQREAAAGAGIGGVAGGQRRGCARRRDQEGAARKAEPPGILACRFVRKTAAELLVASQRRRKELAVRRPVDLDRQPPALGIEIGSAAHPGLPRLGAGLMMKARRGAGKDRSCANAQPVSLSPAIAPTMTRMRSIRTVVAGSPNQSIPTITVPIAPIPPQTA